MLGLIVEDPDNLLDRQSIWPPPGLSYGSAFDLWCRSPSPIVLVGIPFFVVLFIIAFFSFFGNEHVNFQWIHFWLHVHLDGKLLTGQSPGRSSADSFTDQPISHVWHLASKAIDYWTEENEDNWNFNSIISITINKMNIIYFWYHLICTSIKCCTRNFWKNELMKIEII